MKLKASGQIFEKKNLQISNFIKIRQVGAQFINADILYAIMRKAHKISP
jgi:hypothetical protein